MSLKQPPQTPQAAKRFFSQVALVLFAVFAVAFLFGFFS